MSGLNSGSDSDQLSICCSAEESGEFSNAACRIILSTKNRFACPSVENIADSTKKVCRLNGPGAPGRGSAREQYSSESSTRDFCPTRSLYAARPPHTPPLRRGGCRDQREVGGRAAQPP